jgi:glycosyltransferase involved in cell wall biosynthesis
MINKILHLSFDYSLDNIGKSSVAVSDLINQTSNFSQPLIISLKRKLNPFSEQIKIESNELISFTAFGLSYGLFLSSNLKRIFNKLNKFVIGHQISFSEINLIHSHKLTYEGFIGYRIAKEIGKPLFISLRGTDFRILKLRPDLKKLCHDILAYSSIIFFIAPYMKDRLKKVFGEKFYLDNLEDKLIYLPNSIDIERFNIQREETIDRFITILWLNKKPIKNKNLYGLFQAISELKDSKILLDVIGYGNYEDEVKKWTYKLAIENQINFLGFIDNKEIPRYLSKYKAFLLPSHSETFGLAYAESLLCGTPILYTQGTGFDGLFEGVGVAVNSKSISSISEGIKNLSENYKSYKENINNLKLNGSLNIFSRKSIENIYKGCFNKVISGYS